MMRGNGVGLENIKEKLLEDAREKARVRLESARTEADRIRAQEEKAAAELKETLRAKARAEAASRKERILSEARMKARNVVLAEKQKALDEVFGEALESFARSGDGLRAAVGSAILREVETGEETVSLAPSDREAWGEALLAEINRTLQADGRKGELHLSASDAGISSGAVLHKAGLDVNLSLEVVGRQVRERAEERVAKALFGNVGSR